MQGACNRSYSGVARVVVSHNGLSRRVVIVLVAALIGWYYLWAVRASGTRFEWKYDLDGYYDLLGRGFAGGHLYLPLAVDHSSLWQDMVLYQNRYYLYFGAAPAVLLFTPWRLLTGHDLPQTFAMFLLCYGGFLFASAALLRILELAAARPGPLLLAALLLALGVCQSVPYLLNRVAVYEIPIGAGYFFLSAALFFLARGIRSLKAVWWLAAAGLMFGCAVASRPHLGFAGAIATAALAIYFGKSRGWSLRSREFIAFALALTLAGLAIATYNYQRFGNPFEFGFRYQLAGPGQNRVEVAPRNLLPGFYFMLLSRPEISPVFPWMRMVFRFPFDSAVDHPLPPEYFIEPTVGALWVEPLLLAALLVPGGRRLAKFSKAGAEVRVVLWIAAASSLAILLFLMSTHLSTHRYETDFVAIGVFAAVANLGIHVAHSTGWRRVALGAVTVLLIAYSAIANLALGLAGPYDDILKNRPKSYVRIASWFSPVAEYRPTMNPEIAVDLRVQFVPEPPGFNEPLITTGHWHYLHFLYVEHREGALRFVSKSEDSIKTYDLPDPGTAPVSVQMRYSPADHQLTVAINGQAVIEHLIEMLVTSPAHVEIGRNLSDMGLTARKFTGRIDVVSKRVR